jgi:glycosyltransferase involved in cell wall biosynthesis
VAMTGNFDAFQNRQGLAWFLTQVWPQIRQQVPQARLQLIGRGANDFFGWDQPSDVVVTGSVPTAAPYLRRATIAVVPLLHGSGTRFKILEAWACETPVVSTTLGVQGIDLTPGQEDVILADSGPDFAREVIALLQDGAKRSLLTQNGLNTLRNEYSFEVNTWRVQRLIEESIAQ